MRASVVQKEKDLGNARSHIILNFSWIICMLMLFLTPLQGHVFMQIS